MVYHKVDRETDIDRYGMRERARLDEMKNVTETDNVNEEGRG